MQNPIKIALIQLAWPGSIDSMQAQYRELVAQATSRGATLICLPEFSLLPYFPGTRDKSGFNWAEPLPGGVSDKFFAEMARTHQVTIIGSIYEQADDGGLFDTATIHSPNGNLIGATRKVHIPSGDAYHETDFLSSKLPFYKIRSYPAVLHKDCLLQKYF